MTFTRSILVFDDARVFSSNIALKVICAGESLLETRVGVYFAAARQKNSCHSLFFIEC